MDYTDSQAENSTLNSPHSTLPVSCSLLTADLINGLTKSENSCIIADRFPPVAQLDNAADSDSEDRGFESLPAGQKKRPFGRFFNRICLWQIRLHVLPLTKRFISRTQCFMSQKRRFIYPICKDCQKKSAKAIPALKLSHT